MAGGWLSGTVGIARHVLPQQAKRCLVAQLDGCWKGYIETMTSSNVDTNNKPFPKLS